MRVYAANMFMHKYSLTFSYINTRAWPPMEQLGTRGHEREKGGERNTMRTLNLSSSTRSRHVPPEGVDKIFGEVKTDVRA